MAGETPFVVDPTPDDNDVAGQALTMNACDPVNGNTCPSTDTERLVIYNTHATLARTFTITGVADPQKRSANFSKSVPALGYIKTGRLRASLWNNGGLIFFPASNTADLQVGVIQGD